MPPKGYGFIGRESGEDVFVHLPRSSLTAIVSWRPIKRWSFPLEEGPKGLQAANVVHSRKTQPAGSSLRNQQGCREAVLFFVHPRILTPVNDGELLYQRL